MENENCLNGIQCPKCGNQDRFLIEAMVIAEVTDDGADLASPRDGNGFEWNDNSHCRCPECEHFGPLQMFSTQTNVSSDSAGTKHFRVSIEIDITAADRGQAERRANLLYADLESQNRLWLKEILPNGIEERHPLNNRRPL